MRDPHSNKQTVALVVDDEEVVRKTVAAMLGRVDFQVHEASNVREAEVMLKEHPIDLVLVDLRLDNENGMDVIDRVRKSYPETESILMTAYASIENAVEAMRNGAWDYITKPFTHDELVLRAKKAVERKMMRHELTTLRAHVALSYGFDNIVGVSRGITRLKETAQRVAPTDINVLISGPSGTGKELFAKAIHHHSSRRNGPLITIDCSTIPETLFESELFGHVKGAFTGAERDKEGLLGAADGGTVFFDEINNIPASIQPKLLRFLQDSIIRPVGGTTSRRVDVRIVAATNRDLGRLVSEGKFREDLFYRLNVIPLNLPPLTDRAEDIALLTDYFLRAINRDRDTRLAISPEAVARLESYHWPGNVRELENTLKRAAALCQSDVIDASSITFVASTPPKGNELTLKRSRESADNSEGLMEDTTRSLIARALRDNDWNFTRTAKELGIGRTTLWRKVKKYDLKRDNVAAAAENG